MKKTLIAFIIATASTGALAIDPFTPLTAPATSLNTNETTNPFLLPTGWIATKVTDHLTLSIHTSYQSTFGRWDMTDEMPSHLGSRDRAEPSGCNRGFAGVVTAVRLLR